MTKPRRTALDVAVACVSCFYTGDDKRQVIRALKAAVKDKERLDWLSVPINWVVVLPKHLKTSDAPTLRAAIDAALKSGRRGGKR
jgi:hypothetical protein